MSEEMWVSGEISIHPPVPAARLAGSGFVPGPAQDAELAVQLLLDGGGTGRYVAVAAAADEDGRTKAAPHLVPHLNRLLALIGPGHDYDGVISCAGMYGDEDLWRVRVVDGAAVGEDAEVVYPADWTAPADPAVVFDPTAARCWLRGQGSVRPHEFPLDLVGPSVPAGVVHRPSQWLGRVLRILDGGAAPHVWRCPPQVRVEVVASLDPLGVPDGGAALIVTVAGVRLASPPITARDLTDACNPAADDGAGGRRSRLHEDAVVALLGRAAQIVTAVVQRYRAAQLAVPPFTIEHAAVLLDALHVLQASDVEPWTDRDGLPGSALLHRTGYRRTMRDAGRVVQRLIDRGPAVRSGLCWHSVADFDRHGVPGIKQVAVSSRCAYDGCDVTCWVVDRAEDGRWRLALVGSDDGRIVADAGVVLGDTYPDETTARRAADLFEATGSPDPGRSTGTGGIAADAPAADDTAAGDTAAGDV